MEETVGATGPQLGNKARTTCSDQRKEIPCKQNGTLFVVGLSCRPISDD